MNDPVLRIVRFFSVLASIVLAGVASATERMPAPGTDTLQPKLIMVIVVDGLPQEQVLRYRDQYVEGGFKRLLSQGRTFEAETLLLRTLSIDPKNGFTLNNLGVAKEAEGDYSEALRYYGAVAGSRSTDTVVVTMNANWRGKSVSDMAAASARKLSARMKALQNPE